MMSSKQGELNFQRGDTLQIVKRIQFEKFHEVTEGRNSVKVRGVQLARVLEVIESGIWEKRSNGWQRKNSVVFKVSTIARKARISVNTARRAIRALCNLDVLIVEGRSIPGRQLASEYFPIWSKAIRWVPSDDRPASGTHDGSAATHGDRSDTHSGSAATHGGRAIPARSSRPSDSPPPPPEWAKVADDLKNAGVTRWMDVATEIARRPGMTAKRAVSEIQAFNDRTLKSSVGLLVHRLRNCDPDETADPAESFWRTPASAPSDPFDVSIQRETYRHKLESLPPDELREVAAWVELHHAERFAEAIANFRHDGGIWDGTLDMLAFGFQQIYEGAST